jgi:hypothetical protein
VLPPAGAILFRAPAEVAANALLASSTPTFVTLVDAVAQVADAYVHAQWQRGRAARAAADLAAAAPVVAGVAAQPMAVAAGGVPGAAAAAAATTAAAVAATLGESPQQFAATAAATARFAFENLMCVWLAHSLTQPALRVDARDLAQFAARPGIAAALRDSPFAELALGQLQVLAYED